MGALFLGFFKKTHKMALRVLVVLIFINPGMPLYLTGLKYISTHTHLKSLDILHKDLQETKEEFEKKHGLRIEHEENLKKENLLEKVGHALTHAVSTIEEHIVKDLKFFTEFTKKVGIDFIKKSIHLLVFNIVLFFLLPLLYIYMFLVVLSKLFNFPLDKDHINDLIAKIEEKAQEKIV